MDEAAKKSILRLFTYGLYAITCGDGDARNAFTANWLTQVSFEPPLVALSVENDAASLALIRASGTFAICVLARSQRELAGSLGRPLSRAPQKLDGLQWLPAPSGAAPVLADCLGWLRCRVESQTPAGDSTLLVARVIDAGQIGQGEPLTMREAGFRHSG